MYDIITIFFTGMLISFLGALPLGTLNITAMQISLQESSRNALRFALGVALVEILYVRISLKGMNWIMQYQQVFTFLEWLTVVLFIILSVSSFRAAYRVSGRQNILLNNKMNRFFLGFTMSALNPVQIPFWFIWSTYLLSNKFLLPKALHFNIYTAGIGIGTLIAMAVFIYAGKWLVNKMNTSHRMINIVVGIVFAVSAILQLYRLLIHKPH